MAKCEINVLEELKSEFSYLENDLHKEIFLRAVQFIPEYFWVIPASSSGKYHPKSSLGLAGLLRHVKSAFRVAQELFGHPLYGAMFTPEERDEIRIAILLHDACKRGIENKPTEHTLYEHPMLVRDALHPWKDGLDIPVGMEESWNRIAEMVESHMGCFNKDKEGKEILPVPSTKTSLFVHMCDYLSSRKGIEIEGLEENKPPKPDWKGEVASTNQIEYIVSLYEKCSKRGKSLPTIKITDDKGSTILTKGEAASIITNLKAMLE